MLKPQDVVVLLKLAVDESREWSFAELSQNLGMSPSQVHAAIKRAIQAGLLNPLTRKVNRAALEEFIVHGLRYVFFAERGPLTRGMPTGYAAPPLASHIASSADPPPVWPDAEGTARGEAFAPLYRNVPRAAKLDSKLYECLSLVDAIRGGRARERKLAEKLIKEALAS